MAKNKQLTRKSFLEELSRGRGIKEIFRDYGYKSCSLYYKWKSKHPEFKDAAEKILASPKHKARILESQTAKGDPESWRVMYINKFREQRDRVLAADYAGKTITQIVNYTDAKHDDFDEEFYNMVREEELREAITVEDELKRKAVVENSLQMQKWIIPFLPVVGDKYYRGAENRLTKVKEEHNTVVFFQPDGVKSSQKLLETMFGREEKEIVI